MVVGLTKSNSALPLWRFCFSTTVVTVKALLGPGGLFNFRPHEGGGGGGGADWRGGLISNHKF